MRQRFTFTRQGAVPAPGVTCDTIQQVTLPDPTTTITNVGAIDFEFDLEAYNEDQLNPIVTINQDFNLTQSDFIDSEDVINVLQLPDEGYLSSGSPSGSDNLQQDNSNVGNILDLKMPSEAEFIIDTSFLATTQSDPTWSPEFVMNIDPVTEPELYDNILSGGGKVKNKRHAVKHRRGQTRLDDKELKDQEHARNVNRSVGITKDIIFRTFSDAASTELLRRPKNSPRCLSWRSWRRRTPG